MFSRFLIRSLPRFSKTLVYHNTSLPSLICSDFRLIPQSDPRFLLNFSHSYSSRRKNDGDDKDGIESTPRSWSFLNGDNDNGENIFDSESGDLNEISEDIGDKVSPFRAGAGKEEQWSIDSTESFDVFKDASGESVSPIKNENREDEWETAEGYKPWTIGEEVTENVFGEVEDVKGDFDAAEETMGVQISQENEKLEMVKQALMKDLKGPDRAFGDLISASGITEEMIDSLIFLKNFEGVPGLPPLKEIEEIRLEKNERKSRMVEDELKKQEEISKARVRQVDEKGRAYGTGRRKTSSARVWIQPGNGKFTVNDKEFDAYFPILDHRANLLKPFAETETVGLWDVYCTVKGGGVSGQAGAIRLGITRALQNWEPGFRPLLKAAGFLTRDPRAVERKKPGKAKARKSFQWVKR